MMQESMVSLRQFNIDDATVLQEKQMIDASQDEIKVIINECKTKTYKGKYFEMLALIVENTVVGSISLYGNTKMNAQIGVEVFSDERRKGYATEGMRLMMEKAGTLGYRIIQDQMRADNATSIILHEKLGFETDGYFYTNARKHRVLIYLKCI